MSTIDEINRLITQKEERVREYRRSLKQVRAAGDENRAEAYEAEQRRLDEEIRDLVIQRDNEEPLYSEMVVLDTGVADFIVNQLQTVVDEIDKELERTDLYPNMRDWVFKKKRAFQDVIWMMRGSKDYYNQPTEGSPPYLVFAELPDGSVELFEEDSEEEADARIERLSENARAITVRYVVVPESGAKRAVYRPITERDNVYKELPPGILRRVVEGAGGPDKVRWPENGEQPVDRRRSHRSTAS